MKRSALRVLLALVIVGAGLLMGPSAWSQQAILPGINVADDTPNGCVDCHKVAGGADTRLNVLLSAKKHVDISAIVKSVPDGCVMCHREGVQAGPLNKQTHRIHYTNPKANTFVTAYRGSCLACHSMDVASGIAKVKFGPKNW